MKSSPISVRLNSEAMKKCKAAQQKGYTMTEFIEQAVLGTSVQNKSEIRNIVKHICHIETIVSSIRDESTKGEIREELKEVCQILRSYQETS